ncbi:MAG: DNA mismatch repair endonuclease MutH [Candidatus Dasytiphilus stammeri]
MINTDHLQLILPPKDEKTLLTRANVLAGFTLNEVADSIRIKLKYHKGWVGMLMEKYLGADAGNKSEPDFTNLGIELKTIPIDLYGKPLENTFICTVSLSLKIIGMTWNNCSVRKKIKRILWIPIEGNKKISLGRRKIGTPFFWSPTVQQEYYLRLDWEDFMDSITWGNIHNISARNGEYLQIKTKSSSQKYYTQGYDKNGQRIRTRTQGFYFKKIFTTMILKNQFLNEL